MNNSARIYISGPMRGRMWYNFPAFNKAAEELTKEGWEVFNPAAADMKRGYSPFEQTDQDWDLLPEGLDLNDVIETDLGQLQRCNAIYLLKGWDKSVGARAEFCVARWLGLDVFGEPGYITSTADFDQRGILERLYGKLMTVGVPWENINPTHELPAGWVRRDSGLVETTPEPDEGILDEANRLTSGDRQNQYGPPDQDFARTAQMWSTLKGVPFEPWEVAAFQICIKLSRQTHQRKRDNWADIAGYAHCGNVCDEEADKRKNND